MKRTIFAILTDKQARSSKRIQESLDKEFIAGAPWFNKLLMDQ